MQEREWRIPIESDEEIDVGFSCYGQQINYLEGKGYVKSAPKIVLKSLLQQVSFK